MSSLQPIKPNLTVPLNKEVNVMVLVLCLIGGNNDDGHFSPEIWQKGHVRIPLNGVDGFQVTHQTYACGATKSRSERYGVSYVCNGWTTMMMVIFRRKCGKRVT